MKIEKRYGPAATAARVEILPGEQLTAEAGAFLAMGAGVTMQTSTRSRGKSGAWAGIKRMVTGESFFLNHFSTHNPAGSEIWLGTPLPGDMLVLDLQGQKVIATGGCYVASDSRVGIELQWQGMKSALSGEGLFWVSAQGEGPLLLSAFGEIFPVDVDGEYIVDTGHIVAFDETLSFSISKVGDSWFHSFLGGEGFACRFNGKGKVWCQSHSPTGFGWSLSSSLRPR